jgi:hypothetical protein
VPLAHHIIIALTDRRVLATSTAARRQCARIVTEIGQRYGLLSHGLPDNHGHAVAACDRADAGLFARALQTALRRRLDIAVPFRPAYYKPVVDQSHLRSVVRYVHRQAAHHDVDVDPYYDATSLPDLVGARIIVGGSQLIEQLAELAPRIKPAQLLPAQLHACASTAPTIEQAAVAAAAAIGRATLTDHDATARHARRAALAVALPAVRRQQAAALGCSLRTLSRTAREPALAPLVTAVRMQASWRFPDTSAEVSS